jgi:succinylarginine dihydrolase
MRNGGGPACLRLRVALTDDEAAAMHQGVIMTEDLYARLVPWVEKHYRDRIEPKDLADPQLAIVCMAELEELERILGLPGLYELTWPAQARRAGDDRAHLTWSNSRL